MKLLNLISREYLRRHVLLYSLVICGIAVGTAVFVAAHAGSRAMLASFRSTVGALAGGAELQVSAGEAGVPEDLLERVQTVPEVERAVPVIEALAYAPGRPAPSLLLLGVDLTSVAGQGTRGVIAGRFDALEFLAQPDSLLISAPYARAQGIGEGARLALRTMEGVKKFAVRGVFQGEAASAFGGQVAIMDIYAAQKVFGRGFAVRPPASRVNQLASLLRSYAVMQNVVSLLALLLGICMIDCCLRLAVAQRRTEIGILRALGASRTQVLCMFLGECAIAGLAGSVVGLAAWAVAAGVTWWDRDFERPALAVRLMNVTLRRGRHRESHRSFCAARLPDGRR